MLKKVFFVLALVSTFVFAQMQTITTPKFELKDIYGKTTTVVGTKNGLDIPSAKGKVVLLEFWGTHCPPCLMSIPHYVKLNEKYKDKLAMFAIEVQGTSKERLLEFAKANGINYNIYTQDENMDFVRYIAQRAGWRGAIPFLVIFDTNGNVVDIKKGMVPPEYIEKVIEYIFNKQKNSTKESNSTK